MRLLRGYGGLLNREIAAMGPKTGKSSNSAEPPDPQELLTPKEFAKAKKVSISWLAKARKRGDGPAFIRFGRSVRYFPLRPPK